MRPLLLPVVAAAALLPAPLPAQAVRWQSRVTLYGDNTEFFTPYRVGETILGGQFHSAVRVATSARTAVTAGVFGDVRWGSGEFLDVVRPILSFRYAAGGSTGVLGALETDRRHGLLDALAVSTLELTRPVEYGLQWIERRRRWDVDVFLNWQALNTPVQREVFDYGWVLRVRPAPGLTLESQLHGLHHGGQLHDAGVPVTNNVASAVGVTVGDTLGWLGWSAVQAWRLWSAGNIDPDAPAGRPDRGRGTLLRASVAPRGAVEVFGLLWRGRDFLAQEGDPNYGSVGADPGFYRPSRTYAEIGVLRRGRLDGAVTLDAEFRLHRVDDHRSIAFLGTRWEYSYRLVVRAPFAFDLPPATVSAPGR
jgi:hypothetical protein